MKKKEERPDLQGQEPSAYGVANTISKDTKKISKRQKKILKLLLTGKRTVTEMTIKTGFSDPRGYMAILRKKGLVINDEWITYDNVRYKKYWIDYGKEQA